MDFNDIYFDRSDLALQLAGRSTSVTYGQYVDACTAFGEEPLAMNKFVDKVKSSTNLTNESIPDIGKDGLFAAALAEWTALGYGGVKSKKHPRFPIWVDKDAVDEIKKPKIRIRPEVMSIVKELNDADLIENKPVTDVDYGMIDLMKSRNIEILTKAERQSAIEIITGFNRKNRNRVYSWTKRS